jgi:hypothetical protein
VKICGRERGCRTKAAHALRFSLPAGEAREHVSKYAYPQPASRDAAGGRSYTAGQRQFL